jgi:hydrogenase nickel incorporation protein HypA/HybF
VKNFGVKGNMHELSMSQQILDIAVKKAQEVNATTIRQINLVIGEASSVLDDCVQFYFDFLSRDSLAQEAQLSFKRVPLTIRCCNCNYEFNPTGETWNCPQCQRWDIEIAAGKEFYIESIEVDQ